MPRAWPFDVRQGTAGTRPNSTHQDRDGSPIFVVPDPSLTGIKQTVGLEAIKRRPRRGSNSHLGHAE